MLQSQLPPYNSIVSLVLPQMTYLIKTLQDVRLFKFVIQGKQLTILDLQNTFYQSYSREIARVEEALMLVGRSLSDMLQDSLGEEQMGRAAAYARFSKMTQLSNYLIGSILEGAVEDSVGEIVRYFRRFYAYLPTDSMPAKLLQGLDTHLLQLRERY